MPRLGPIGAVALVLAGCGGAPTTAAAPPEPKPKPAVVEAPVAARQPEPEPPPQKKLTPARREEGLTYDDVIGRGGLVASDTKFIVIIQGAPLREHPLAEKTSALLGLAPLWDRFLDKAGLDVINDFERATLVGPWPGNAGRVVAVFELASKAERLEQAIERYKAIARTRPNSTDPSAEFRFVDGKLLVVGLASNPAAPRAPLAERLSDGKARRLNQLARSVEEAFSIHIGDPAHRWPWRRRIPMASSVRWMSIRVFTKPTGEAYADVELHDLGDATEHARELTTGLNETTEIRLSKWLGPLGGMRIIEETELVAEGDRIRGTLRAAPGQQRRFIGLVHGVFEALYGRATRRASGVKTKRKWAPATKSP